MRICFVTTEYALHPPFGGIATYMRDAAHWLVSHGHEVHVVCIRRNGCIGDREDSGVCVHFVGPQRIKPRRVLRYASNLPRLSFLHEMYCGWDLVENSLGAWLAVQRVAQKTPFDLIECTDFGGLAFWGLWPVQRHRILLRGHGILHLDLPFAERPGGKFHHYLEKQCAHRADFILTASEYLARSYKLELGVKSQQVAGLPYPFRVADLSSRLDGQRTQQGPLTILYVGRIEYEKGADLLFSALRKVSSRLESFRALLIGAAVGEFKTKLETFLSENHRWVSYLGSLPQHDVFQHMSEADILVLPSRTDTLPRSLIEALSFGLPQIATNIGGIPEIVEDGVTGLLVEPDDPDALAEAILKLCASPDMRTRMQQNSRARALEKFEITKVMAKQVHIYQALIEDRSPHEVLKSPA